MEKRKSGLAVLIGIGRKKIGAGGDDEATKDEPSSNDLGQDDEGNDKEDMALGDLAEAIGVPEHELDNFKSAFKSAVKACLEKEDSGDY